MALAASAEASVGRVLGWACRIMALGGGLALLAIAGLTVLSIAGRSLSAFGLGPIKGDFELVAHGAALAIFSFLPLCQLNRGHVTVDIVVDTLPPRIKAALGLLGDLVVTAIAVVILWRLWLGFGERWPGGSAALRKAFGFGPPPFFPETTYELEMPLYLPFGFAVGGAALFVIVCLYTVWRSLNWTLRGTEGQA